MSISPKSERVALLWGDRWWIEDRAEPVVFGELARAVESLLAAFAEDRPARLRLIHQPAFLAADAIACPKGDRATLQVVLGEQYPALFSEDRAWAFEPIFGGRDQYATILYHESQPGLYPLVQAIESAGIVVTGAWPLAHLLNLVPEDWPETGALTVVAVEENQTVVFRHLPDGRREVQTGAGEAAESLALETVRATLARQDTAPYLVALDLSGERLAGRLPPLDVPRLRFVGWTRLVDAAGTLTRRQPAQLLPLSALFNPGRAVVAASVTMALVACGLAGHLGWSRFTEEREAAANAVAMTEVRNDIAARQQAQTELAGLKAAVEAGGATAPVFAPLLRALGLRVPAEVVLTALQADRTTVTIDGGVTRQPDEGAWRGWLRSLGESQPQRKIAEPVGVPTADFRLIARRQP
jgi:hypothetical protein